MIGTKELYALYLRHPVLTTDSRDCPAGSIFLALKGASFDGNRYASIALEKGCRLAIVDEKKYIHKGDSRYVLVDDCLQTYKDLAREHRRRFHIPVIGITGTNGKTTTKELIAAVLQEKYNVLYTQGNFNNDVGVPKTLLRLDKKHEIAVVEMGASHPGDIKTLVETVEPTSGLITNVGRAHLQGFGSFEGVIRTKGELYDYFRSRPDSLAFLDTENPYLKTISHGLNLFKYGSSLSERGVRVAGSVTECDPFLTFSWSQIEKPYTRNQVKTHLIGAYNLSNLLAAISVGIRYGVESEQINHALENYVPSNNRSQFTQTAHNRIIVDAYNANPTSMKAALENFNLIKAERKMAIIGDMRELGAASHDEHQNIVDLLKTMNLDEVWLVGKEFKHTECAFKKFDDTETVKAALKRQSPQDYCILIKGSNSMHLSELPELL